MMVAVARRQTLEPFGSICIYGIQPICQATESSIDEALDDVASNTEVITVETRINGTRRREMVGKSRNQIKRADKREWSEILSFVVKKSMTGSEI